MFNKKPKEEFKELQKKVDKQEEEICKLKGQVTYDFISIYSRDYLKRLWGAGWIGTTEGKNIENREVIRLIIEKMGLDIKYTPEENITKPSSFKLVKKRR